MELWVGAAASPVAGEGICHVVDHVLLHLLLPHSPLALLLLLLLLLLLGRAALRRGLGSAARRLFGAPLG